MYRVSNRMLYNNAQMFSYQHNKSMLKSQEELASGKRLNHPSDDPSGAMQVLRYRDSVYSSTSISSSMERNMNDLYFSDSTLGEVMNLAARGKELALQQTGGAASASTRLTVASEIRNMVDQAIQIGNSLFGGEYAFAGQDAGTPPVDTNGNYVGSPNEIQVQISDTQTQGKRVLASSFLTTDMNPKLTAGTALSTLFGGAGIPAGTFTITDRGGGTGTVNTAGMVTVTDLINGINASGANVTASLAPNGYGIQVVDNTATPTQNLTITDTAGNAAATIGIAGSRAGSSMNSFDLNPAVTANTLLADLYNGNGISVSDIKVVNSSASATVTFAGAVTVGDVLNAINAAPVNATASINSTNNRIVFTSNTPGTVAYATDIGNGTFAENLGLGGGKNLITVLQNLDSALRSNDIKGIIGTIENITDCIARLSEVRGEIGSRQNMFTTGQNIMQTTIYDVQGTIAQIEDADMAQSASDFMQTQTAYGATIKATAAIMQQSLVDFIRL